MRAKPEEIVSVLREEIQNYDTRVRRDETGTVLEVGDGIATVYGLDQAVYGELVELDTGVKGMVMNLARDSVGVVLLGSEAGVREGTVVRRTGRAADVPVGDGLIGRVVDVLGQPIDGLGPIETTETRPIEHEASGVVSREPVNVPLQTGILAIDAITALARPFFNFVSICSVTFSAPTSTSPVFWIVRLPTASSFFTSTTTIYFPVSSSISCAVLLSTLIVMDSLGAFS